MSELLNKLKGDRGIWIVLIILSMFSLLVVYSSTGSLAYRMAGGKTFIYLLKQFGFLGLGFLVIHLVVSYLPVKILSGLSPLMLAISFVFMLAAFVFKVGHEATGRTFHLGPITFQPAELAKIALVLFVSRLLANNQDSETPPSFNTFLWIVGASGLICGVIALSNFSTAALLFSTIMILMFIGRVSLKYLGGTIGAGILFVVLIFFIAPYTHIGRFNTVRGRIERFFKGDPQSEVGLTQADFAILAVYSGGQAGRGPGGSEVRNHMAAAYNDFIFAILVEEYGWMSFLVIFAYIVFATRAGIIIKNSRRSFQAFIVAGFATMIVLQAIINMGVSVGLLPVTGQTLPWVSMGGTSTLFTAFSIGCILRVSYQNSLDAEGKKQEDEAIENDIPDEDQGFEEIETVS
jgi:cell division protein FtsW